PCVCLCLADLGGDDREDSGGESREPAVLVGVGALEASPLQHPCEALGQVSGVGHRGPSEWIRSEMRSSSFSASQSSCASSSRNTASRADAALFALASTCSQGRLPSLDRGRLAYMLIGCPSAPARRRQRPPQAGRGTNTAPWRYTVARTTRLSTSVHSSPFTNLTPRSARKSASSRRRGAVMIASSPYSWSHASIWDSSRSAPSGRARGSASAAVRTLRTAHEARGEN